MLQPGITWRCWERGTNGGSLWGVPEYASLPRKQCRGGYGTRRAPGTGLCLEQSWGEKCSGGKLGWAVTPQLRAGGSTVETEKEKHFAWRPSPPTEEMRLWAHAIDHPFYLVYSCPQFFKRQVTPGFVRGFFCLLSLAFQVVQILRRLNGESGGEETRVMREEGRGPGLAVGLCLRI